MRKIGWGLSAALAVTLSGCAPEYHAMPVFHHPSTPTAKRCISRCLQQKKNCDRRSGTPHRQCLIAQKKLGHEHFINYVNAMISTGHKVKLTEADFMDYDLCPDQNHCTRSYKNCYRLCGGVVTEHKVCVKNCSHDK